MSPSARPPADRLALVCRVAELTALEPMAAALRACAAVVESLVVTEGPPPRTVSLELSDGDPEDIVRRLLGVQGIESVERVPTMRQVYGQRIIVVGGGAQVGQVALGAISEADRHNIRGQKISIDTIPVVGEEPIADAVRAVARLPRAAAVVLAGSLMGGKITEAVREVRGAGILVISLNMAGSAPREADLVVTDPVQAGVMAVMAIAETARFDIEKQRGRTY